MSKIVNSDNLLQFGQEFLENLDERYLVEIDDKQDILVSGTNIKTVNNQSLLGPGNIEITSGTQSDWNQNESTASDYVRNRTHYEETGQKMTSVVVGFDSSYPWGDNLCIYEFMGRYDGRDIYITRFAYQVDHYEPMAGYDDGMYGLLKLYKSGTSLVVNDVTVPDIFDGSGWPTVETTEVNDITIGTGTVHKLPNKFLDMDSTPTPGSGKPVTSGGVKAAIADFVTRAVNDLLNYYTKTETYTKAEVNQLVAGINNWEIVPVAQLPEASADTMHKIYLVPSSNPKTRNVKDEFITVEVSGAYSWEQIGTTAIDLTNYVTTEALTAALANYVTSTAFTEALAAKQDKIDAQHKLDYSLLDNTPEIPDPSDFATKEEVSQLRSEVDDKKYSQYNVQYTSGKWIDNNGVVGTGSSGTLYRFNAIPVIPGQMLSYETQRSGVSGPSLIIADANDNVLIKSDEQSGTVTAPNHAARLYFNSTLAGFSLSLFGVINSMPEVQKQLAEQKGIELHIAQGAGPAGAVYPGTIEQGNINGSTGANTSSTKCIRTLSYVRVWPGATYTYSLNQGFSLGLAFYDSQEGFLGKREWLSGSGSYQDAYNGDLLRIVIYNSSKNITPADYQDAGLVLKADVTSVGADCAPLSRLVALESIVGEAEIYAPEAQHPADGSSGSDFDAENLTPQALYDAFDDLGEKIAPPSLPIYPKYITKYEKEGYDETSTHKINAYVLTKRNRYAWKSSEKLYAWKNGDTVVYIDSCSPRVGDVIYSDNLRTISGATVSSYDSSTQTITASDSTAYTRYKDGNVAADILFSDNLKESGTITLYNKNGISQGSATLTDSTHATLSGKVYARSDSYDYHTDTKGTVVIWANEHGAQSDPYEGSVSLYNLARDLTLGGFRNHRFLLFLKEYVKVVLIPCANPYSMYEYATNKREGRFNANGVNLNRNYDTPGWGSYSGEPKGSYAGDQSETQFIMNTCLDFNADLAVDVHCLSYTTQANQGKCHYSGYVPNSTANNRVGTVMGNYGLAYTTYGNADPQSEAGGKDWIYFNGISGGLIEMNAGLYSSSFNGKQHSAFTLEADYTLLLNAIRMWWYGVNPDEII